MTNHQRRNLLKASSGAALVSLLAAAGIIAPGVARAEWRKPAFEAKNMADTLKALGAVPVSSPDIVVSGPEIAENGAAVNIGVSSTLANVSMIAILIEKNLSTLSAIFHLPPGTEPNLQTRVKMAQSSRVVALLKADGQFFMAHKEIKVTLGGCSA